jgi:hypothetical protein
MRKTKTIGGNRGFVPYRPGSYRPFVPNSGPAPAPEGEEEGGELCVCVCVYVHVCECKLECYSTYVPCACNAMPYCLPSQCGLIVNIQSSRVSVPI